jgi:hypothetical protein
MPSPAVSSPIRTLVRQQQEDTDDRGNRLIRHVGESAFLTSRVDAKGRLIRQEFLLGEDFVVWQHGTRLRTGICRDPAAPQSAKFDLNPSRTRIERARLAAEAYRGEDRYIKHLARVVGLTAGLGMPGAEVVTESDDEALLRKLDQRRSRAASSTTRRLLLGGGVLAAAGVAWLLLHR